MALDGKRLRPNKFGNIKTACILKHKHDSILEANTCTRLYSMCKKEIQGYKIQKAFPLFVNNKLICTHIVDFWILNLNNTVEVWDAKGKATPVWSIKRKLFTALYPAIPYKVIKKDTFMPRPQT